MFKASLLVLISVLGSFATASGLDSRSAARKPGVSYQAYKTYAHMLSQGQTPPLMTTPVDEAKAFGQVKSTLPAATVWSGATEMQSNFEKFRDLRFIESDRQPGFLRRSSWLYPDDGCFARAALAVLNLGKMNVPTPKKVFVFGDLSVKSKNSPDGEVTWWYHVAPLVEVAGQKFVLDPAIDPKNPLRLEDWLATMSKNPESLEVAVCGSGSYTPYDACQKESDGLEAAALDDQPSYLNMEWSRIRSLGRNPEKELGDLPPWL